MMKKTLATSNTCGPCFALKSRLSKMGLSVEIKSMNDPENIQWFRDHGIKSLPCLVVETEDAVELVLGSDDIVERIQKDE